MIYHEMQKVDGIKWLEKLLLPFVKPQISKDVGRELDCTMTIKRLFGKLFVTNLQLKAVQPKEKI